MRSRSALLSSSSVSALGTLGPPDRICPLSFSLVFTSVLNAPRSTCSPLVSQKLLWRIGSKRQQKKEARDTIGQPNSTLNVLQKKRSQNQPLLPIAGQVIRNQRRHREN
jgi:hypothetical protein